MIVTPQGEITYQYLKANTVAARRALPPLLRVTKIIDLPHSQLYNELTTRTGEFRRNNL